MHSLYARVNNGFAFMSTCLMAMLAAIALSSFLFTADPKGKLVISNFKVYASPLRYAVHPVTDIGHSVDAKVDSRFQEVGLARFNLTAGQYTHLSLAGNLVAKSLKTLHRCFTGTQNNCSFISL